MQTMDFFEFREQHLTEAAEPVSIRKELNILQRWWNDNHIQKKFMSPPQKKGAKKYHTKAALYPILSPPFDRIRSGGLLIMGYNPRANNEIRAELNQLVADTIEKHGKVPDIYDPKKKKWFAIHKKHGPKTNQVHKKKYFKREDESQYDTKDWLDISKGNGIERPDWKRLSKSGAYEFQSVILKMLEDVEFDFKAVGGLRKVMATNYCPFASDTSVVPAKSDVDKACIPFMKSIIKQANPSMIICSADAFKAMQKHMNLARVKNDVEIYAEPSEDQRAAGLGDKNPTGPVTRTAKSGPDKGKMVTRTESLEKYFQVGILEGKIPVVCLLHWTGHNKGGPDKATWQNGTKRKLMGLRMSQLARQGKNKKPFGELIVSQESETEFQELPVQTTKEVKPKAKAKPASSKPSKAYLDTRFDAFEKLNADRLPKGSKDYKQFNKDAKSMTYDDLLAKWAVPGKLKRP